MRIAPVALALTLLAAGLAGCGHSQNAAAPAASVTQTASAAPAAPAEASPGATAPSPSPGGTATPEPTPTPNTNLLSWRNGAVLRSYPAAAVNGRNPQAFADGGFSFDEKSDTVPLVWVYELPGAAAISSFSADMPAPDPSTKAPTVDFAVSSTGPTGDFKDAGTITASTAGGPQTLSVATSGRWIRVTTTGHTINAIGAAGVLPPLPPGVSPIGNYVELDDTPYQNGTFNSVPTDKSPWYRHFVTFGTGLTATRCFDGRAGAAYPGDFDGRTWTYTDDTNLGRGVVNDDASMIVGSDGDQMVTLLRTTLTPKFCAPQPVVGNGPHRVLLLDNSSAVDSWPWQENSLPGYSYDRVTASMLDPATLAGAEFAILNNICLSKGYFGKGQGNGLMQWVADGHKLLILEADTCGKTGYDFLPYQFASSNPGAHGASGKNLILVESDALGSDDKTDAAHFFDPKPWADYTDNQLGDANTVTTQDPHWCGHLFGTNVLNVNGFMQMYAAYGKGELIYDGFDRDDSGQPGYDRVRTLEFQLPVPNDLPCTQKVSGAFVIQPNQEGSFTAGTASTPSFSMELLANQGWKGHVAIATTGDFQAAVTPNGFDMAGGTQPLKIAVTIPASAKAGSYTVTVTGTGSDGQTAQASISFSGTAPLKKEVIKKHQRIRIYGIHFDYDSAHIQPRSEPVIADIAAMMKANPAWRFELSGHTDSDGGAAYNLGLSQRRAQSVVDNLVKRYGIARARLVPKGYGLTRPVASNATDAGKALNRRVELERLQ